MKAKFIGGHGSLGFKKGNTYDLDVKIKKNKIFAYRSKLSLNIAYDSLEAFLKDWEIVEIEPPKKWHVATNVRNPFSISEHYTIDENGNLRMSQALAPSFYPGGHSARGENLRDYSVEIEKIKGKNDSDFELIENDQEKYIMHKGEKYFLVSEELKDYKEKSLIINDHCSVDESGNVNYFTAIEPLVYPGDHSINKQMEDVQKALHKLKKEFEAFKEKKRIEDIWKKIGYDEKETKF